MLPEAALAALMTVTSPDGANTLTVSKSGDQIVYAVSRKGQALLEPAPIGLDIRGLTPTLANPKVETFTRDLSADVPFYTKRSHIDLKANGATADFGGLTLTVLATDQGVAYRWGLTREGEAEMRAETFTLDPAGDPEFLYGDIAKGARGDLLQNDSQSLHHRAPLGKIDPKRLVYLPITLLYEDAALALTEAELRDFPGLNLRRPEDDAARLVALLAKWPTQVDTRDPGRRVVTERADWLVRAPGPRAFPWRVFMLADNPAGLYDNDLVEALSEPAQGDFSWVKPGQVAWEWWNHWGLDDVPFKPGVNTATYCAYIDFAAQYGIPYVILDDGWSQDDDLLRVVPQIDLPAILAHAKDKGVGIVLWSDWPLLLGRQEELFAHYAGMGVVGFKVDHFNRDDARIADFLYETAAIAAKHKLILAFHGITKPTGLSRTFPNVLTYEGVYGLEQGKWIGSQADVITNDIRLAFGRLLAGPADYTPGAMRNASRKNFRPNNRRPMSMGTRTRQAALFMLYDTNFQMLCDSPSAYTREPAFTKFLASVPLTWDDTRCDPSSEPDSRLLVHRRKGDDHWYAAIVGAKPQTIKLPLKALGPGTYVATILRDSPITESVPTDYILQHREVTAKDTLDLPCATGGGFLIKLTPKR